MQKVVSRKGAKEDTKKKKFFFAPFASFLRAFA
jgi:hypothetical protein